MKACVVFRRFFLVLQMYGSLAPSRPCLVGTLGSLPRRLPNQRLPPILGHARWATLSFGLALGWNARPPHTWQGRHLARMASHVTSTVGVHKLNFGKSAEEIQSGLHSLMERYEAQIQEIVRASQATQVGNVQTTANESKTTFQYL